MKTLVLEEKRLFWLNPNFRLDFYLALAIGLVMLLSGLIFRQFILLLLGVVILLLQSYTYWRIFKTLKRPVRRLELQASADRLILKYEGQSRELSLSDLGSLVIVFDPKSKEEKDFLYQIFCKCGKKEKLLFDKVPASMFTRSKAQKLREFIDSLNAKVDLIILEAEELF